MSACGGAADGTDAVAVEPPSPTGDAAAACAELTDHLPPSIGALEARPTTPASPYTAAWGDPAVVLRCGVPQPDEYEPTSVLTSVDDVDWLPVPADDPTRFVAAGRVAWVEVEVPPDAAVSVPAVLVAVGEAVADAVPVSTRPAALRTTDGLP